MGRWRRSAPVRSAPPRSGTSSPSRRHRFQCANPSRPPSSKCNPASNHRHTSNMSCLSLGHAKHYRVKSLVDKSRMGRLLRRFPGCDRCGVGDAALRCKRVCSTMPYCHMVGKMLVKRRGYIHLFWRVIPVLPCLPAALSCAPPSVTLPTVYGVTVVEHGTPCPAYPCTARQIVTVRERIRQAAEVVRHLTWESSLMVQPPPPTLCRRHVLSEARGTTLPPLPRVQVVCSSPRSRSAYGVSPGSFWSAENP